MILGARTARLVREAIVLAHVEGAQWASGDRRLGGPGYPRDSEVVARVVRAAKAHRDVFPNLSTVEGL